jgi:nucleoside-diphosphate-sugar epimerase
MRSFIILVVSLLSILGILHALSAPVDVRLDPPRKKVVIFGSTGRTGRRVVDQIFQSQEFPPNKVICPVRDMRRARSLLGKESAKLSLVPCDLANDKFDKFVDILYGSDVVVICSSYTPKEGSLPSFKGAKMVDNIATKRVIDAAVAAGVSKVVLVSSLLTNGIGAGQIFNPQYLLLNAFGGILIQKVKCHICQSYTYQLNAFGGVGH